MVACDSSLLAMKEIRDDAFCMDGREAGSGVGGGDKRVKAPMRLPVSTAPALVLSSGTLEALKWLALLLMTLDHVNKHLLHASVPELSAARRLALPQCCALSAALPRDDMP